MRWEQLLSSKRVGESAKKSGDLARSAFEQDYDRIIFSHPFRRLQDKTQVHPLPEYDFVHTRLTHSLEVSSVGRTLGKKVGEVVLQRWPGLKASYSQFDFGAITAAACLTHDLGNPPFGHSGEDAISDFFKHSEFGLGIKGKISEKEWHDLVTFEGNAQGFRILNKKHYQGLKLTYATLAAFSKYPRESFTTTIDKQRKSHKKFGFYQSEKEIFKELAEELGLRCLGQGGDYVWSRHPLAFLVEAADDICYHIIDLEDGCRLGLVSYEETVGLLAEILGDRFKPEKLKSIHGENERIGLLRAMAIGILTDQAVEVFLDKEQEILDGDFDEALTGLITSSDTLSKIIKLSINKIYRSRKVVQTEAAGFEVLPGLLNEFTAAAYHVFVDNSACSGKHKSLVRLMPDDLTMELKSNKQNIYKVMMACTDFVASMTDTYAIALYRRIKGISLPNG